MSARIAEGAKTDTKTERNIDRKTEAKTDTKAKRNKREKYR